jgi:hypothetical protein
MCFLRSRQLPYVLDYMTDFVGAQLIIITFFKIIIVLIFWGNRASLTSLRSRSNPLRLGFIEYRFAVTWTTHKASLPHLGLHSAPKLYQKLLWHPS